MVQIYSRYNNPPKVDTTFDGDSLTQQHFAADADINNIIAKYAATGVLGDPLNPGSIMPMFDDFTNVLDYHTAQTYIANALQSFAALPSDLRLRFNNDPGQLISFIQDDNNREEAVRLGFIQENSNVTTRVLADTIPAGDANPVG